MTHQLQLHFVLWSTVFGLIAASAMPAFATDVVVSTDVTTTQTLYGNDSLSVTASGNISTTGNSDYGIYAEGGANTISNSGTISTTGFNGIGISAIGGTDTISNSGMISTTGDYGRGIVASGGTSTISNSGTISTSGDNGWGIYAARGTNTITNSGMIGTTGDYGFGIIASSGTSTISNSGTISTSGDNGWGIYAAGGTNTITNSGMISTTGDTAYGIQATDGTSTISNSGTIGTTGFNGIGIYAAGGTNTITNSGTISTTGDAAYGIRATDGTSTISNSGTISTTGSFGAGIVAHGGANTVTNSGTISTTGDNGYGIEAGDSTSTITNSGTINTTGVGGIGIYAAGNAYTISNSDTISTTGSYAYGIYSNGSTNTITNSGTISTTGYYGAGIYARSGTNTISNSGTIRTTGIDGYGIYADGGTLTITNSGRIMSAQSYAIYFSGSGNTLNLNIPSFLGGGIELGSGTTVNVVSGASNSVLWRTTGTLTGSPSLSGSVPIFFNASTGRIATFDPTGFAGASDVLADTTGNVSKLIHGRLDGLGNSWWMSGFGSAAKYDGSTATLERKFSHDGMVLGYDTKVSPGFTLGALTGYGRGNYKADSSYARSFDNKSNGGFVGIYGQQRWQDMFVNVALSAGFLKHTDARFVNDNSASLGVSGNRASYTSIWVSPQATVGMNIELGDGWTAIPAAHVRYAWQSVKGYSETGGGDANAQVGGRTVQMVESRPELGVRKTLQLNSVGPLTVDGRAGWLYRSARGDNTVRLTMIDQRTQVATEMRDRSAAFVGVALSLDLRNNVTFKLHGETVFGGGMRSFNGLAMLSAKF
jgi:hypothetical protein